MADKIIDTIEVRDRTDVLKGYLVRYELESGGAHTHVEVEVLPSEMSDPSDLSELRSKANAKASLRKSDWVASLDAMRVCVSNSANNGDVTL